MANKTYWQKLKDPRWQKKRLEVLSHYDFRCQKCFDAESTLHVHHKEYFKDCEPWEYDLRQLTVLCEACHEEEHHCKDMFKYIGSFLDFDGPMDRNAMAMIIAGYTGFDYQEMLAGSGYEDSAFTRAYYDLGIRATDLLLPWDHYMEEKKGA
jgi:hypothetical protein